MFTFTGCPKRTIYTQPVREHVGFALKAFTQFLAVAVLSLMLVPTARAQVLYGSLVGNVSDSNGAAIPGAKVEMTNVATGAITTAMTDDRGAYSASDLQIGLYKVSVSKSSFKTTIKDGIRIEANKTHRFDAELEI